MGDLCDRCHVTLSVDGEPSQRKRFEGLGARISRSVKRVRELKAQK